MANYVCRHAILLLSLSITVPNTKIFTGRFSSEFVIQVINKDLKRITTIVWECAFYAKFSKIHKFLSIYFYFCIFVHFINTSAAGKCHVKPKRLSIWISSRKSLNWTCWQTQIPQSTTSYKFTTKSVGEFLKLPWLLWQLIACCYYCHSIYTVTSTNCTVCQKMRLL